MRAAREKRECRPIIKGNDEGGINKSRWRIRQKNSQEIVNQRCLAFGHTAKHKEGHEVIEHETKEREDQPGLRKQ